MKLKVVYQKPLTHTASFHEYERAVSLALLMKMHFNTDQVKYNSVLYLYF